MSNSSSSDLINTLFVIQYELTQYVYSLWLIFGITGCIFNLIIFSRPQLRVTSCCVYFFAASADHLLTLIVGIGSAIYTLNHSDPQTTSLLFCKIRGYIFQVSLMLSRWFIAFACIDRYASSSDEVNLRNFAKTGIAYRIIIIITIVWSIFCIHRLIFYEIQENLCGILTNTGAAIYHSLYVIIGGGILPAAIMIICSLLIRRNLVHKQQKRIHHVMIKQSLDQQVLHLLFIQIVCYIIFTIPQLANLVFNAISDTNPNRSNDRVAIERSIAFIAELMLYMFPVTSFYLYTLTSRTFRSEFIKLIRLFSLSRVMCWRAQRTTSVQPVRTVCHHVKNQQTEICLHTKQTIKQLNSTLTVS